MLFIAGAPRSGSTLIERVIAMHSGFCALGESHFIWERSFGENHLCGCGAPFHDCPFWREVSGRALGAEPAAFDFRAAIALKRSVDRKRHLPWLMAPRRPRRYQASLNAYGDLLERLYRTALEVSGKRAILDSSKDPRHGLILSRLPGFRVNVVHLIRDPRAVAFSWRRQRRRPEIHWSEQDMPVERISTTAARWSTHNALVEVLGVYADSYLRVRYEDFIAHPRDTLRRILAPYPWLEGEPIRIEDSDVVLEPSHTVSGNPMRFERGQIKIKLDDEWQTAMSAADRLEVGALTWPLLLRHGYPLRAGTGRAKR